MLLSFTSNLFYSVAISDSVSDSELCSESELVGSEVKSSFWHT